MTNRTLALSATLAAVLWSGVSHSADPVSVKVTPSRDTTIFSESGSLSNGAGSYLFTGETNEANLRRALLAFDVTSAVPSGSTIQSVSLTVYVSRTRTGDTDVALHRLLAAWGEAGSNADAREGTGAPAETGDATWTHRFHPGTAWTKAGGDYSATPSATTILGAQNAYFTWTSDQMRSDVQAWLDAPASNHGWILVGKENALKVAKRLDSRENIEASTRPVLTLFFTPASPTGACCATDGTCSVVFTPGTECGGAWQGNGVPCDPNPCPQPTGACCLPTASGTCVEDTEHECGEEGGTFLGTGAVCTDADCPVVLEPYVDPLPRPAVATPVTGVAGGAATYALAIREVSQKLHRDLPATRVWGFGDGASGAGYPGPTIEAASGAPVTVNWINDLRDESGQLRTMHYLPVDPCPHGAHHDAARTVIHLHGGHVPEEADGYPEATFEPGQQATYVYPNAQMPGTLWYHDHALGITRLNVYMGMAGFYLLRDPLENGLGLPSGEFEIPLALQDRSFHPDGTLKYPAEWVEHFFGDTAVVNGKVWPYLDVKRGKYRLRLLNGATSRTWALSLSSGATFQQIGTDGGLLPAPVPRSVITIAPGERADVVVDFSSLAAGTEVELLNSAPSPYPNGDPHAAMLDRVMKFVVLGATGHTAALPATLRPVEPIPEGEAVIERDFELRKGEDACSGTAWFINGLRWDDITEYPELGTAEIWRFVNRSGVSHPMHMHLVMFQVLDRQPFTMSGDTIVPTGSPSPPAAWEAGWKDTVQVGPNELVRVIARFENYKGKFAYHCHILEHEDHEMMRQFQTVSCGDGEIDPGESCDSAGANGTPGSCCSASCEWNPAATVCRADGGECDPAETCSGSSAACPDDAVSPDGTPCSGDGDVCTDDACDGAGTCAHEFDPGNDPACEPTTTTTIEPTTTTTVEPVTTTTLPPAELCGDANGSGDLTASDALAALRTAVGTGSCTLCLCDVNSSGTIVSSDSLLILKAAVGQAVELVCPGC
jgi:spore coat protein A